MRSRRMRKKWNVAVAVVAVVGAFAAVAFGSVGGGFTPTSLVTGSAPERIWERGDGVKLQTKGPTDVRVQRIDIAAGGFSGWHHHPGIVIAVVESGAVTFTSSDCSATTYGPGLPAGSVFTESGSDPGQASSVEGATLYATFIAPQASPPVFRIEDAEQPQPCVPPAHKKHHRGHHTDGGGKHT